MIPDGEYENLYRRFPTLKSKKDICPTCGTHIDSGPSEDCDCQTQRALRRHYLYANIGIRYHTLSLDDLYDNKDDLRLKIEDYIENFSINARYGKGITFYGPLGTGKSFAQILILKELVKKGYKAWFESFSSALDQFSSSVTKEELVRNCRSAEIFALDEVYIPNTKRQEDYFSDVYEQIIRYRVENALPTLIGTNLLPDEHEKLYPRVASLLSMVQEYVEISGRDVRADRAKNVIDILISEKEIRPIT